MLVSRRFARAIPPRPHAHARACAPIAAAHESLIESYCRRETTTRLRRDYDEIMPSGGSGDKADVYDTAVTAALYARPDIAALTSRHRTSLGNHYRFIDTLARSMISIRFSPLCEIINAKFFFKVTTSRHTNSSNNFASY